MTEICLDATTLISVGTIGELEVLTFFDGELVVPSTVRAEVTTEPARTNLSRFVDAYEIRTPTFDRREWISQAMNVLGDDTENGDVSLIAAVLAATAADRPIAVVSDDRRVRTTARGLGATVTGTVGVVVRAVDEGYGREAGHELIRRLDAHGLHMTGSLRETAFSLIDTAASTRTETE